MIDHYKVAYLAYEEARRGLAEATKAAFPIGMSVVSHARANCTIYGTVSAVCEAWSPDVGCIYVKNSRTGKSHRAAPFSERRGVDIVNVTAASEGTTK